LTLIVLTLKSRDVANFAYTRKSLSFERFSSDSCQLIIELFSVEVKCLGVNIG
jgi:hypothetical protein